MESLLIFEFVNDLVQNATYSLVDGDVEPARRIRQQLITKGNGDRLSMKLRSSALFGRARPALDLVDIATQNAVLEQARTWSSGKLTKSEVLAVESAAATLKIRSAKSVPVDEISAEDEFLGVWAIVVAIAITLGGGDPAWIWELPEGQ